jgi:threonine synthase
VVEAFESGADTCVFWPNANTRASGLRVPKPFADRLILQTIRESGGLALAVEEQAIDAAQKKLATSEGIFTAPEAAATLAGLLQLSSRGLIHSQERVLLLSTATGLKYLEPA